MNEKSNAVMSGSCCVIASAITLIVVAFLIQKWRNSENWEAAYHKEKDKYKRECKFLERNSNSCAHPWEEV